MYDSLKIVKGAISTKDLVPVLTHVAIHEGRACGFDGRIYISAPVPEMKKLSFTAAADQFYKAIESSGEKPEISLEQEHLRLHIEGAGFSAQIPAGKIEDFFLYSPTTTKRSAISGWLLDTVTRLRPFVADDASRPWANGVWVDGKIAAATNNVIAASIPLDKPSPFSAILPIFLIDELIRIGKEPTHVKIEDKNIILWLPDGVWIRSVLIDGAWPKSPQQLLDTLHEDTKMRPIPEQMANAISAVKPFCADESAPVVEIRANQVKARGSQAFAQVQIPGKPMISGEQVAAFRAEPLASILPCATHFDLDKFPRVPWKGEKIRGGIIGVI